MATSTMPGALYAHTMPAFPHQSVQIHAADPRPVTALCTGPVAEWSYHRIYTANALQRLLRVGADLELALDHAERLTQIRTDLVANAHSVLPASPVDFTGLRQALA